MNEYCSTEREPEKVMKEIGESLVLGKDGLMLNEELLYRTWKEVWVKLKEVLKTICEKTRIKQFKKKEIQNKVYSRQDERCHQWLECNLDRKRQLQ